MKHQMGEIVTVLDAVVDALARAGSYNRNDQVPPAAVLWPDKERQWEPLLPLLRARLPLLTFGAYNPAERSGPAYWLRCMIAGTIEEDQLPTDVTPIIYLPGVSKQELRAVEECPRPLQAIAELQYRGVLWTHRNGRDWTVSGFLQATDGGLGVEIAGDNTTRDALLRSLGRLANEPIARLKKEAPLRAAFFDALLNPDEARSILLWLNDPEGYRRQITVAEWDAFANLCKRKYGFHPLKDGPVTAAQLLGQQSDAWAIVWRRFVEAPRAYPNLRDLLRRARPPQLSLFDVQDSWPQDNEAAETQLRERLLAMKGMLPEDGRAEIARLEQEHGSRRAAVWAELGHTPLAAALNHLQTLANRTARSLSGGQLVEIVDAYAGWGYEADAAAIDALASVESSADVSAVSTGIDTLYRPWLEQAARSFQQAMVQGSAVKPQISSILPVGTCLLFCDSLRFDLGQRLARELQLQGMACTIEAHLGPLPGITPTAKPAISPVAEEFTGEGARGLEPVARTTGTKVTIEVLRTTLTSAGYQILKGDEVGNPSGRGWTELGAIDVYGHRHGISLAQHLAGELRALERRIHVLVQAGWQQIIVVTDHGWLLLPSGLPKAELPEHLTVVRKERCARLKDGSTIDMQKIPWHWDHSVTVAIAPGICCYEAGQVYAHGGLSPQECVLPRLVVTRQDGQSGASLTISSVVWRGLRCSVTVSGGNTEMRADIRTRAGDESSSIGTVRPFDASGTATILVGDDDYLGMPAFVVVLAADGSVRAQLATVVGGD